MKLARSVDFQPDGRPATVLIVSAPPVRASTAATPARLAVDDLSDRPMT
ncbi:MULTISPECIES: hypothetical protein [unclassified Rhodococcus (in: high G+C Gram-positive bacteria)]|nr:MULTISPECIES: hypothetical protein [unclassified Rhodococcus (in: high G+C Gram-positive bacteria)]